MTDQTTPEKSSDKTEEAKPQQPKQEEKKQSRLKKWFKRLFILALLCVCAVVGLYFYATSASFFDKWVRPAAEKVLGRDVTVGTYTLSPMSGIKLEDVEIAALEGEDAPALKLKTLNLVYNLQALFSKRLEVSELTLDSLTVRIRQNPDGSITGPFPLPGEKKPKKEKKEKKETSLENLGKLPIGLDIRNVKVSNLNIEFDRYSKEGAEPDRYRIQDLSITAPEITLDKDSVISLSAGLLAQLAEAPSTQTESLISGKLSIDTTLQAKDGIITGLTIAQKVGDLKGVVEGWDLSPYAVQKNFNLKIEGPTALSCTQVATIYADGKDISESTLAANFDLFTKSGEATLSIPPLDRRALNLAGAVVGIDFRDTKVSANASIKIAPQMRIEAASLNALVENFNATGGPIPEGDLPVLNVKFGLTADSTENVQTLNFKTFALTVDRLLTSGKVEPVVLAKLKQPIALDVKAGLPVKIPAELLDVTLHDLDLAAWSKFAPMPENINIAKGLAFANLSIGGADGKTDAFALKGKLGLKDLSATIDKETIGPLSITTDLAARTDVAMRVTIQQLRTALSSAGKSVGALSVTGNLDANTLDGNFKIDLDGLNVDAIPATHLAAVKEQLSGARVGLASEVRLMMSADRISANGTATVENAKLLDPAQKDVPPKVLPRVAVDFTQTTDIKKMLIDLTEIVVALGSVEKPDGQINVTGKLDLLEGLKGNVAIRSDSINLVPLLAIGGITPAADAKPLVAKNFGVDVVLSPEVITAKKFSVALAEGLIAFEQFDMIQPKEGQTDPTMKWLGVSGENIDLETLIANVAPDAAGYLRGTAGFATAGSAQGFSPEAMEKSLRLTLDTFVKDGEIIEMPLAKELALVTNIDEFKRIVFKRFDSKFVTKPEGIMVEKMEIVGVPQKIGITGKVGYDQVLDLMLDLAIGDKLKAKTEGKSYARILKTDSDGFLHFPTPLGVSGTTSKPKIALKISAENILDLGTNALQNELLKKRQEDKEKDEKKDEPKSEKDKAKDDLENQLINMGSGLLKGFGGK